MNQTHKYKLRTNDINATRWFRNGDHPKVFFIGGSLLPLPLCKKCGFDIGEHGVVKNDNCSWSVCPGDYVIEDDSGIRSLDPYTFRQLYRLED